MTGKQKSQIPPHAVGWGIIFTVILVAVMYVVLFVRDNGQAPSRSDTSSQTTTPASNAPGEAAGSYVAYSQQNLAAAEGKRWLFFHAGWCPQCRAIEQDIEQDGVPEGVTILKVNYDTATDLKKKYGVTLQTTFVSVDEKGNQLEKFVAYDDPTLDAVVGALGDD
jgi:thiol-disulfide isomerase/thioredoxin